MNPRSVLLLLLATALATPLAMPAGQASAQLIAVDPGHGGADPGGVGCGREEEDIVLDTAIRLQALLLGAGFEVLMTRTDDRAVALSARSSLANSRGADRFVSIHSNANAGTPATGTETFVSESPSANSVALQGLIQEEMIAAWGLRDRGSKRANFSVLTNTTMPATLSEMGFINHCEIDSPLLGSPERRQEMAQAHFNAIMRHYGRDPGMPPTGMGTLRGVVFEDVGAGLEDTSRRLAGATVTVGDASATSEADTGNWSFSVAAGSATVRATLAGFEEASRTCDVTSGAETWCSIGLTRSTAASDAGPPMIDAGPAVDAGTPATDSGVAADAATGADAGMGTTGGDLEVGCAAAPWQRGTGSAGWALLALGLLALGRRRRISYVIAPIAVLLCLQGCGSAAPAQQQASLESTEEVQLVHDAEVLATLEHIQAPVSGTYAAAEMAPTGARVALSLPGYAGVDVWDADQETILELTRGERRGFAPVWNSTGDVLGVRVPGQTETAVPMLALTMDGREVAPVSVGGQARVTQDGTIVLADGTHLGPAGDRYFAPRVSPDGRFVVFQGVSTGLYVYERDSAAVVSLGMGTHARFSADSTHLVYAVPEDDGHVVVASRLWLVDLSTRNRAPIGGLDEAVHASPSLSNDGTLAWLRNGELRTARLVR